MPYNKYSKRRGKKKTYARRRPYRRRRQFISRFPVSRSSLRRHTYSDVVSLTPNATNYLNTVHVFRANGMYDPDVTGTGHQPLFFDQMSDHYHHFSVLGSKCTFTFTFANSPSYARVVGGHLSAGNIASGEDGRGLDEQPTTRCRLLSQTEDKPTSITIKYSKKKYHVSNNPADHRFTGTPAGDPPEQSYFVCYQYSPASGATIGLRVKVHIEYIALWTEPKTMTQS